MFHNIDNIKDKKIICVDFDDCLFPSDRKLCINNPNKFNDIVSKNFSNLLTLIKKYELKVFITSSWSSMLDYNSETKKIEFFDQKMYKKSYYKEGIKFIEMLSPYFVGFSEYGNREEDIRKLAKQNKIVAIIDDYQDLSILEDEITNVVFIHTQGYFNLFLAEKKINERIRILEKINSGKKKSSKKDNIIYMLFNKIFKGKNNEEN